MYVPPLVLCDPPVERILKPFDKKSGPPFEFEPEFVASSAEEL
jgi:hypothetical protein